MKNLQSDFQYDVKKTSCIKNRRFWGGTLKTQGTANFRDRTKWKILEHRLNFFTKKCNLMNLKKKKLNELVI